jgi:sulfite reductase alpha subunit-like flavoprotein
MAADVHKELLSVLQLDCGKGAPARTPAAAEALLADLAKAGRYVREIWYG